MNYGIVSEQKFKKIIDCIRQRKDIVIYGIPGSGKTFLLENATKKLNMKIINYNDSNSFRLNINAVIYMESLGMNIDSFIKKYKQIKSQTNKIIVILTDNYKLFRKVIFTFKDIDKIILSYNEEEINRFCIRNNFKKVIYTNDIRNLIYINIFNSDYIDYEVNFLQDEDNKILLYLIYNIIKSNFSLCKKYSLMNYIFMYNISRKQEIINIVRKYLKDLKTPTYFKKIFTEANK